MNEASGIIIDMGKDAAGNLQRQEVSLLQLAQVDMTSIEEYRFENRPAGVYVFRVKNADTDTIEVTDEESGGTVKRGAIVITLDVINCLSLNDPNLNPADQIGTEHREMIFLSDLQKGLGRLKALMNDAGFVSNGPLDEVLNNFKGFEFVANITVSKSKKDPDKEFSNLSKVKPMGEGATPAAPAATTQAAQAGNAAPAAPVTGIPGIAGLGG